VHDDRPVREEEDATEGTLAMDRLRARVVEDEDLVRRLVAVTDDQAFVAAVVVLAGELDIPLRSGDVVRALDRARRDHGRWV
jgi:hypothetical protein